MQADSGSTPLPLHGLNRLARRLFVNRLSDLRRGTLVLRDGSGADSLGEPADLHAEVRVHRARFFRHAVCGGALSVAESYLRGDWDCDDLTALFRLFIRNTGTSQRVNSSLSRVVGVGHRLYHWWHANSRQGSRRNIAAHYDLGNDFFELWLDPTLAYSSGIFSSANATLESASRLKFETVCRKLDLHSTDRVVEIGTGWGGFALHAAEQYGCHVTTTTISKEQFDLASQRVAKAKLGDRVTLLQQDYRDLNGQFDKLVSIEMIEAVGHRYFDQFFHKCSELLQPDGSMLLQCIVMPDRGYSQYLRSVDFIQRYIFPGGCLPSLQAMLDSIRRRTDLRLSAVEDLAPHYAQTLRCWRANFEAQLPAVRRLGYSERFIRMWRYYLCYCEAAFDEHSVGLLQLRLDKPNRRTPLPTSQTMTPVRSIAPSVDRFPHQLTESVFVNGRGSV